MIKGTIELPDFESIIKNTVEDCFKRYFQNAQEHPAKPEPEFISSDAACEVLGIKKPSLYGKVHRNEIPFYKEGKKLMFKRSELIDVINKSRKATTKEVGAAAETQMISGKG